MMNQFCNAFSCAVSDGGREVVVNFRQRGPVFGENGDLTGTQEESIETIVMSGQTARNLADVIIDLLEGKQQAQEPLEIPDQSEE